MDDYNKTKDQLINELADLRYKARELEQLKTKLKNLKIIFNENQRNFVYIFENAIVGMTITDLKGNVKKVNKTMCKITGYSADEFDQINIIHFYIQEEDNNKIFDLLKKQGSVENYVSQLKNKQGQIFEVNIFARVILYNGQKAILTSLTDITRQQLAKEELLTAKEITEEAIKVKQQFLTNISHEIRTPLNGIVGMTDLTLGHDNLTPEQEENLLIVKDSAFLLLALINNVLELSLIEKETINLNKTTFNIKDTFCHIINNFYFQKQTRNITLNFKITPDIPNKIVGDEIRLRQIIINLVSNGIKYNKQGGEVIVQVERASEPPYEKRRRKKSITLLFSIIDTGVGIPEEKHHAIFDPFTQADASTSRSYEGLGIGLSISKSLVEMMGGKMWFESNLNIGSTFYFTITFELC